jgi:hypothetical protein
MGFGVAVGIKKDELVMRASIVAYSAIFSYSTSLKHMNFMNSRARPG